MINRPGLHLSTHPLIQHKLTYMRDEACTTEKFNQLLRESGKLLGYEATKDFPQDYVKVKTPKGQMSDSPIIGGRKAVITPILRAGLIFAEGLKDIMPTARTGHIGLHRDHASHSVIEYLVSLPDPTNRMFILVDPIIATGRTARRAVELLKDYGVSGDQIIFMALIVSEPGWKAFSKKHPEVRIYAAACDPNLDSDDYVVPGIGDVGDRLFGTRT